MPSTLLLKLQNDNVQSQFDINQKIVTNAKDFGIREISVQMFLIKGNLDFSKVTKFIKASLVSDSLSKEGFEKRIDLGDNILTTAYLREGNRTHRFVFQSEVIPTTLQVTNDYCLIRFCRKNSRETNVFVYGGSQNFVKRAVFNVLRKVAVSSECQLIPARIRQLLMRRLCLVSHRNEIEQIKIDPSNSKNYAKIIEEEKEKSLGNGRRYEFVIKENLFKGENILGSTVMNRLFNEEPSIKILFFRAAFKTGYAKAKIKYLLNTAGKISFSVTTEFMNCFPDEFKAAEFLISKLETDAQSQLLLSESFSRTKPGQSSIAAYTITKSQIVEFVTSLESHLQKEEYAAVAAILSDLGEVSHKIGLSQQKTMLGLYLSIIERDVGRALELTEGFQNVLGNNVLKDNQEIVRQTLERIELKSLLYFGAVFERVGNDFLGNLVSGILHPDRLTKHQLLEYWAEVKSATDNNKKGKALEKFAAYFLQEIPGFMIDDINLRTNSEELDIVIKNEGTDSFWSQFGSPYIFVEAKNWSSRVDVKEVKAFRAKIVDHKSHSKIGIFIAVNGFTKWCRDELIRTGTQDYNLLFITGEDIEKEYFEKDVSPKFLIESSLTRSIK